MKRELFTSITGNVSNAVYVVKDGRAIFVNERFAEIFALPSIEQLVGRKMFSEIYPDSRTAELFCRIHDQLLAAPGSKVVWGQPSARADGTPFWLEAEARLIEVEGEPVILGSLLDRTDCKQLGEAMHASQQTLRLLLDAMEDRVYVVTDDYRMVYANRKMREGLKGDFASDLCYRVCRGLDTPCSDCSIDKLCDHPLHREYLNELTRLWYSVIELPVRMPGVERPCKLAVARDITERREAEQKIRALSHRLFNVQEDERKHLSRELHDDLGQRLNAAKIAVDLLREDLPGAPAEISRRMNELSNMLEKSVQSIRDLCAGLRPSSLERLGLAEAIGSDCQATAARHGLRVAFMPHGLEGVRLSPEVEINLYRICQEAINNVVRHAAATEVRISLVVSHPIVRMRIVDDGRGFDCTKWGSRGDGRLGLLGMSERAELVGGSFRIDSRAGEGTRIAVDIPIA